MDIAPQTVFIELINFETWEVPNFLSSSIIIIRLGNFHPALWVVGSKLVVAQCHGVYPWFILKYACLNKCTKIQSICSLKKSENDLRDLDNYSKHYVYQKGYGYGN